MQCEWPKTRSSCHVITRIAVHADKQKSRVIWCEFPVVFERQLAFGIDEHRLMAMALDEEMQFEDSSQHAVAHMRCSFRRPGAMNDDHR